MRAFVLILILIGLLKGVATTRAQAETIDRSVAASLKSGEDLLKRGYNGDALEPFEQAVAAFRAALPQLDREKHPKAWSAAQHGAGVALLSLGERSDGRTYLTNSRKALLQALEVRTRTGDPEAWLESRLALANASRLAGIRNVDGDRIVEASRIYDEILTLPETEARPQVRALATAGLGLIDAANVFSMRRERDDEMVKSAIDTLRAAVALLDRKQHARLWRQASEALRKVRVEAAATGLRVDDSVVALNEVVRETSGSGNPQESAAAALDLGTVLLAHGRNTNDRSSLEQAEVRFREAMATFTAPGFMHQRAVFGLASAILDQEATARRPERLREVVTLLEALLSRPMSPENSQDIHTSIDVLIEAPQALARALYWLGDQTGDKALLKRALGVIDRFEQESDHPSSLFLSYAQSVLDLRADILERLGRRKEAAKSRQAANLAGLRTEFDRIGTELVADVDRIRSAAPGTVDPAILNRIAALGREDMKILDRMKAALSDADQKDKDWTRPLMARATMFQQIGSRFSHADMLRLSSEYYAKLRQVSEELRQRDAAEMFDIQSKFLRSQADAIESSTSAPPP